MFECLAASRTDRIEITMIYHCFLGIDLSMKNNSIVKSINKQKKEVKIYKGIRKRTKVVATGMRNTKVVIIKVMIKR
jgi:hypothetical protein